MQIPLYTVFENQIKSLTGFDFQDFIVKLFLKRYGCDGFTPVRRTKDKGCDGIIINSKTIIACYGAKTYNERDVIKKISDDYKDYVDNWQAGYSNWLFIVNHRITPKEIETIANLQKGSILMGIEQIMEIICNELDGYDRRAIARDLNIDVAQYFNQEYLSEIINDLLKGTKIDTKSMPRYSAIDPEEKLKLNYSEDDFQAALAEFETSVLEFPKIASFIKGYSPDEQERIKLRIQSDYKNANGNFKERLAILTDLYLRQFANLNDDDFRHYITVILLYHFEQCIIGKKTKIDS